MVRTEDEIRTHEGLSSLPVFKFERELSASIHRKQYALVSSPRSTLSAGMHRLVVEVTVELRFIGYQFDERRRTPSRSAAIAGVRSVARGGEL